MTTLNNLNKKYSKENGFIIGNRDRVPRVWVSKKFFDKENIEYSYSEIVNNSPKDSTIELINFSIPKDPTTERFKIIGDKKLVTSSEEESFGYTPIIRKKSSKMKIVDTIEGEVKVYFYKGIPSLMQIKDNPIILINTSADYFFKKRSQSSARAYTRRVNYILNTSMQYQYVGKRKRKFLGKITYRLGYTDRAECFIPHSDTDSDTGPYLYPWDFMFVSWYYDFKDYFLSLINSQCSPKEQTRIKKMIEAGLIKTDVMLPLLALSFKNLEDISTKENLYTTLFDNTGNAMNRGFYTRNTMAYIDKKSGRPYINFFKDFRMQTVMFNTRPEIEDSILDDEVRVVDTINNLFTRLSEEELILFFESGGFKRGWFDLEVTEKFKSVFMTTPKNRTEKTGPVPSIKQKEIIDLYKRVFNPFIENSAKTVVSEVLLNGKCPVNTALLDKITTTFKVKIPDLKDKFVINNAYINLYKELRAKPNARDYIISETEDDAENEIEKYADVIIRARVRGNIDFWKTYMSPIPTLEEAIQFMYNNVSTKGIKFIKAEEEENAKIEEYENQEKAKEVKNILSKLELKV